MSIGDMSDEQAQQWVKNMDAHRAEQAARQEADKRDAKRYRWLRHAMPHQVKAINNLEEHEWDAAIDAAMAQTHNAGDHAPRSGRVD